MHYVDFVSNYLRLYIFKTILRCSTYISPHKVTCTYYKCCLKWKYKVFTKCEVDLLLETMILTALKKNQHDIPPELLPVPCWANGTLWRSKVAKCPIFTGHWRSSRIRTLKSCRTLKTFIMSLWICVCSITTRDVSRKLSWGAVWSSWTQTAIQTSSWSICFTLTWQRVWIFVRTPMIEKAHSKESFASSSSQLFPPVSSNPIHREAGCMWTDNEQFSSVTEQLWFSV